MSIAICKSCHRHFDTDDFMDDNIEESEVCPDCYYGGGMMEDDDDVIDDCCPFDVYDDDETEDDRDSRVIREALGEDFGDGFEDIDDDEFRDDMDDFDDRLDAEENDEC